jgi:hypothetical protein
MDMREFQDQSTDEGHDVSEGEIAYRIIERNGKFEVFEHTANDPTDGQTVEWATTREQAEAYIREYLALRDSDEDEDE